MKSIFFTIVLFFFSFLQIGFCQDVLDDNNFVTINEDITQYGITSIFKDYAGYLWIGTYGDGLFRYNSIDFKNYKQEFNSTSESLNSSVVNSIHEDVQHRLWVGTDRGINLYNRDLDRFENIESPNQESFGALAIYAIAEYNEDSLLLGTFGQGLFKFNKNDLTIELIPFTGKLSDEGLLISSIVKLPTGRVLIGTNLGLMTFDPYKEELQLAKFDIGRGFDSIDNSIESMHVAIDNSVWIGTFSSGVLRLYENEKGLFTIDKYPISEKRILSLAEKSNGTIICGTENDGLFEVNSQSGTINNYKYDKLKQNGLKTNSIWTVYVDEKDRIWLGYYNKGVDVYDNDYNKFSSFKNIPAQPNSLNSNAVTAIDSDQEGKLWIGLLDGGVDVYDPLKNKFTNLHDQKNDIAKGLYALDIQTIFVDSKNNKWVGTWNYGLFLLKHNERTFININKDTPNSVFKSNRIMSFAEDSQGTIWIGTFSTGLYSYSKNLFRHYNGPEFRAFNIHRGNIRKVLVDHEDNVWLGSRTGVFKIKKGNEPIFQVSSLNDELNSTLAEPISEHIIFSLFEDTERQLWIGTLGNGLYRYNMDNDSLYWYNINNGLIHESISSITQDASGALWIGGNAGLSRLDIKNNAFTNFNKKDGLLSNSFNYNSVYRNNNNVLFFGNSKGINYFNPDKIIYNQEKPTVYFTDFKISNELITPSTENSPLKKVISKTEEITLNHDQSVFTISYVGTNYTRSENNQYAYYLEGYDKEWNFVGTNRSANYKNIPPGDYIFKVKASNNDGIWNETPTTLSIKVLPAWWATKLAIISYILLTLLLGYIVYRFLKIRIQERRILSFEREKHKQFEALNDKKIQFFTNISHEFRTPLTLILSPLEDIIEKENTQFSSDIKEKLNTIYKNAKRLSRLINELMDFRKLQFNKMTINASQINVVPFIEEVVGHFEEEALLNKIELSVEYDNEDISIWSDPSMLEKIVFNLLSNAFKATPTGGAISVQINASQDLVVLPLINETEPVEVIEIIIKDTGLGIKEENIDKVFDRFYQANEMNEQYYGGTGIGLEMVKSFIDLHKGKIVLTSKEKAGTQFKIYFPLGYSHLNIQNINRTNKNPINEYSESQEVNLDGDKLIRENKAVNKKMVLIVEDNVELRTYLKNELKNEYQIKEAENGLEGLEKANKYIPDLIITDVIMPIMDGFELCERIKTDLKTSHIPLLMVTAKGMQIDKVKGIDSGADVYLNKPFNLKVLRSHLKQLITSRQILFDKYFNGVSTTIISDNTTSLDKEFINNVLGYINDNISDEKLNVENLAGELLLSRSKLYRKIKALTGDTATEFIRKIRLQKARQLIEQTDHTIGEICYMVGFSSPSYFTKCFKDHFGILPTETKELPTEK
ncbi:MULTISPECIES: hybrid sensor histidine kinase/response regulator transcription factor [Arenibacter]|uniref:hybrid sensor histidine kinase/response regulator transcription factor n=1 Tax=Arenibacter TaxID=178469 RepID=UPI0004DF858D|nr:MULTISPECIES: hybrid sensor histidine kinase/response regulator transcription factor [Arenibacter]